MENVEARLKRFSDGDPIEVMETLVNSLNNYFNTEIAKTVEESNQQTSLTFLGIHAVALTIAEGFFNKRGLEGYKFFLETFVDGDIEDKKFSLIADTLHDLRNNIAHQWLGSVGHVVIYDYGMVEGWKEVEGRIFVNPKVYCQQYLSAFGRGGAMWKYNDLIPLQSMDEAKKRLIKKYTER